MNNSLIDAIRWNDGGLVAVIAIDWKTGQVLMQAWMNAEALLRTATSGEAVYWSRSRQQLWHKGESSGNYQLVKELHLDCDGDAIIMSVEQVGGIACHTGRRSCFYRRWNGESWETTGSVLKDPKAMYGSTSDE